MPSIEEKIAELQKQTQEHAEFCGLNPCISEKEIKKFEKKIGIRFPEEYREFLLKIGNGGKQPYLGLYALEKTLGYIKEKDLPYLAEPFPFQEKYKIKDWEEYQSHTFDEFHLRGCLRICNYGCGIDFLLVLSGEAKGEIWFGDEGNSEQLFCTYSAETGEKYNFLTFYEDCMRNGDIFEEN